MLGEGWSATHPPNPPGRLALKVEATNPELFPELGVLFCADSVLGADEETGVLLLDRPGQWEARCGRFGTSAAFSCCDLRAK
jgi:hypothetical protein